MDSGIQLEQYSNPKLKSFNSHSIKTTKITRWYCDICGKSLCSKRSHNDHMNIHKNARPFNCPNCNYSAASKNTLQRHFLRHHQSKEKWSYLCPYCPEMYVEAAGYRNHLKQKHHGCSGTFGCPFGDCKFSTMSAAHFKDHILRHNPSYFEEGTTVKIDLSQFSLKLYLVDDNFGKTTRATSIVSENGSENDEGDIVSEVPKDDNYFQSKYGLSLPKYVIEKKSLDGDILNYSQNFPLPKRILEGKVVSLVQSSPEISFPTFVKETSKESEVEYDQILQMISCDNNKINESNINKSIELPIPNNILKIQTNSKTKREKKVFKTVEGFIDEDIDDDDESTKKLRQQKDGSPIFLQKEKAFKTNEGTYDWDLD